MKTKITMHYNGDGKHEMTFRDVQTSDGYVFLSKSQYARVQRARGGSGNDGTVGYTTYSVDGKSVQLICQGY